MPRGSRAFATLAGSGRSIASPSQLRRFGPFLAHARPSQSTIALELSLRGLLRTIGLKVGTISCGGFELRIRELAVGNPMLDAATEPMIRARSSLRQELAGLERRVLQPAQDDPVCRRLMSMPSIGAVVALTFRSAVDDPARFASSKKVGPWICLTPSRHNLAKAMSRA